MAAARRVLLVEDDAHIADLLALHLRDEGLEVVHCARGDDGLRQLERGGWDALVLDLMLPGVDGLSIVRTVRSAGIKAPVLMLTTLAGVDDRVEGLEAGADDYLVKPFALAELEARARALIRRSHGHDRSVLVHGALAFDTAARSATVEGDLLDLSARELAMLELLLLRCGRVISKEQFVEHLCGFDDDVTENAIEVYVHRLRRKLDPVGVHVQTVRGLGYYLARA